MPINSRRAAEARNVYYCDYLSEVLPAAQGTVMIDNIKCELHIGDAVYRLENFSLERAHVDMADCDSPKAPQERVYHGPYMIRAIIGDKIEK